MGTLKVGWALFNIIGWPSFLVVLISTVFDFLNIPTEVNFPEALQAATALLGVIFAVIKILSAIENWRGRRIDNKEKNFLLDEKIRKSKK